MPIGECSLPKPDSDHAPLLLKEGECRFGPQPFCFQVIWTLQPSFEELVTCWWNSFGVEVTPGQRFRLKLKLKQLNKKLKVCNRKFWGKWKEEKESVLAVIQWWDVKEVEGLQEEESALQGSQRK